MSTAAPTPDAPAAEASATEAQVAADLSRALTTRTAIAPVTERLGGTDAAAIAAAYRVQELGLAARIGETNPRVGRKVGLTSPAVQAQLGVDRPDFGVLLADMEIANAGTLPTEQLIAPKVEAEVAFIMAEEVTDAEPEKVRAAIAAVVPALEIVDSRIANWDITITDTVADNASAALYVLGEPRLPLDEVDTAAVTMETRINGEVVSSGTGADCLGDPVAALVWVAQTAIDLGRPLQAGEVVLSGALGPMALLHPGDTVVATITGLGAVSVNMNTATNDDATNDDAKKEA